jgi:hypothetical protein
MIGWFCCVFVLGVALAREAEISGWNSMSDVKVSDGVRFYGTLLIGFLMGSGVLYLTEIYKG